MNNAQDINGDGSNFIDDQIGSKDDVPGFLAFCHKKSALGVKKI